LRLLHATIADAIGWRCKTAFAGPHRSRAQGGPGAKPEPMSVWLRHRVPALNWMLRGLLGAVPHTEAPERNPFKSGSGGNSATEELNERRFGKSNTTRQFNRCRMMRL